MNKKLLLLALIPLLCGCSQTHDDDDHSSNNSGDNTQITSNTYSTSSTTDSVDADKEIKTISTKDWEYAKGSQFANEDYPTNNAKLVQTFNTAFGGAVTSINCKAVTSQKYGVTDSETVLCIGTKTLDGEMTINFSKKIYSVKLNVSSYYSSYNDTWTEPENPHVVTTVDVQSEIGVGSSLSSVSKTELYSEGSEPNSKTINMDFNDGSNALAIASFGCDKLNEKYGRVMVSSIEVVIAK